MHGRAEYTRSNRDDANRALLSSGVSDNRPVYVFVLRGSFVGKYARCFGCNEPLSGHTLTLVLSQDSSPTILDTGLGALPAAALSTVGPVESTHF